MSAPQEKQWHHLQFLLWKLESVKTIWILGSRPRFIKGEKAGNTERKLLIPWWACLPTQDSQKEHCPGTHNGLDSIRSYLTWGERKSCKDNKYLAEITAAGAKEKRRKKAHPLEINLVSHRSSPLNHWNNFRHPISYQHGSPIPHEQGLPLPPPQTQVTKMRSPQFKGKGAKKAMKYGVLSLCWPNAPCPLKKGQMSEEWVTLSSAIYGLSSHNRWSQPSSAHIKRTVASGPAPVH